MIWPVPAGQSPIEAVYSPRQRIGIALAYAPGECSARQVCELAAAGKLLDQNGRRIPAFTAKQSSVRGIALRMRRGEMLDGADPKATRRMYDRLAARARRLAVEAKTADEVVAAAKALEAAEKLRGEVERLPASDKTLGGSILDAHRSSSCPAPPPEPLPKPEPKPEPEPAPPPHELSPGEWMKAQVAKLAEQHAEPSPPASSPTSSPGLNVGRGAIVLEPELYDVSARRHWKIPGGPSYAYPPGR
jgi:hypothetical protein